MSHTGLGNRMNQAGKGTFPFLKLPVEVRVMIYHYHLTSEKIEPRYVVLTKRWTPIDLLYVSRTIYNEAFFHLYTKAEFVLAVRPESIFSLATCWATSDINADVGLDTFVKSSRILGLIRHVILEVHWPSLEYSRLMDRGSSADTPTTDLMLRRTIHRVGAMLSSLPKLRTIDVVWSHMTVSFTEPTESAPPIYMIPVWLRGLKQVRRKNEEALIRMPLKGPISTKALAENQEDRGAIPNKCRELVEDIEVIRAYLKQAYG